MTGALTGSLNLYYHVNKMKELNTVSFDLGNRTNAITSDGKKIYCFPSVLKRLSSRQDIDYSSDDFRVGQSFIVEIGSFKYAVGSIAQDLLGKPTFGFEKWGLVKQFLFASIAALGQGKTLRIKELRCSIPDDQDPAQTSPFTGLSGKTHQFKVNGQDYTVHIGSVRLSPEGHFAAYKALKSGLLKYPGFQNCVVDLGGGTAIGRVFMISNGQLRILRDYEIVLEMGTSTLASTIASELGMNSVEGKILDAIAASVIHNNPKLLTVHSTSFEGMLPQLEHEWCSGIRAEIRTKWKPIMPNIAQVLVIGGSAPLFQRNLSGGETRYVFAPDPQFYNLQAMQEV